MIGNSRFDRVRISKHGGSKRNKSIEKFGSKYQIRPGPMALAVPVQCPEIARVHFLASGYIGTDRNSATVGRIFQFRAFLAGFFYFSSGYTWSSKYFFLIWSLRRILTTIRIRHIGFLVLACNRRCKRINAVTSRYYLRETGLLSLDYFIPL